MITRLAAVLVAVAAASACATPRAARLGAADQRAAVESVLRPLEARHTAALAALDRAAESGGNVEPQVDAQIAVYRAARREALTPLAARGNAEAMARLADVLRDSEVPEDVARWLELTTNAAEAGNGEANAELVRWFWHLRNVGTIAEAQANRARALDYAARAAAAGEALGVDRIGVYISGNVHQYPADVALGGRALEICARLDHEDCQGRLVGGSAYEYRETPLRRFVWLDRLARRNPARYAAQRDAALARLAPAEQEAARAQAAAWRPASWAALAPAWRSLSADILAQGASSSGPDAPCTTATPWCRGRLIKAGS